MIFLGLFAQEAAIGSSLINNLSSAIYWTRVERGLLCCPHQVPAKGIMAGITKNILRTSAVSSTNFGSILIFASCVIGTMWASFFFRHFLGFKI